MCMLCMLTCIHYAHDSSIWSDESTKPRYSNGVALYV